jgi:uncharacterized membrane protein YqiK
VVLFLIVLLELVVVVVVIALLFFFFVVIIHVSPLPANTARREGPCFASGEFSGSAAGGGREHGTGFGFLSGRAFFIGDLYE